MLSLIAHIEEVLRSHATAAIPLEELLRILLEEHDRTLDLERLRMTLLDHPGRVRLVDSITTLACGGAVHRRSWVVSVALPDSRDFGRHPRERMRESLRWVARGLDHRSTLAVSRWEALASAELAVGQRYHDGAA